MYVENKNIRLHFEKAGDIPEDGLYVEMFDNRSNELLGIAIPAHTAYQIGRALVNTFQDKTESDMPIHWSDIESIELDR